LNHALLFPHPGDRGARTRRTARVERHDSSSSLVLRTAGRLPTIRLWLICGVGVVVAATLLSAAVSVHERFAVVAAQTDLQHRLRPAQEAAAQLARSYVDQETGQRGFLWTGQTAFLEPFDSGQRSALDLQVQLRGYVGSDPEARRLLDAVGEAGRQWQQRSALPDIAARRAGPIASSVGLARATEGKVLFDQLRQQLAQLGQRIDQLTEQQIAVMERAQRAANLGTGLGALVAVLAALVTVVAVSRLTTRPLARLVAELTEVADGATDQRISVQGPAELRTIAAAAETMRTGLVRNAADLAAAQHLLGAFGERERMAEHLRDRTIQRLFALGLSLSHLIGSRPELAGQAAPLVHETDAIAQELRGIIYPLPTEAEPPADPV
jgi:CHASE3 domain sensor protein